MENDTSETKNAGVVKDHIFGVRVFTVSKTAVCLLFVFLCVCLCVLW